MEASPILTRDAPKSDASQKEHRKGKTGGKWRDYLSLAAVLHRLRPRHEARNKGLVTPAFMTAEELARVRGGEIGGLKERVVAPETAMQGQREQGQELLSLVGHTIESGRVPEAMAIGEQYDLPRIEEGEVRAETTPLQRLEGQKEKGRWQKFTEGAKLLLGKIIRGNIVKHIEKVYADPEKYAEELQKQLTQALIDGTTVEDPNFLKRHNRVEAFIAAAAAFGPWLPILPIPPYFYSTGSLITTLGINIPNTAVAFFQGKFRKGFAYLGMTALGIATGVAPFTQHATNTFYMEFLQRRYDHAETHNSLNVIGTLSQDPISTEIVTKALADFNARTGKEFSTEQLVALLEERHTQHKAAYGEVKDVEGGEPEKTGLLGEHANMVNQYANLTHSWKHPFRTLRDIWPTIKLRAQNFQMNDRAVDINHKIHTIPQLTNILKLFPVRGDFLPTRPVDYA